MVDSQENLFSRPCFFVMMLAFRKSELGPMAPQLPFFDWTCKCFGEPANHLLIHCLLAIEFRPWLFSSLGVVFIHGACLRSSI